MANTICQYALMTHFFADPLSVLLVEDGVKELQEHDLKLLCEAMRNTPSFRL